ncbi:MAG: sigma-70 family RNA polymerase sigma factor [Sedimentisphaerales bacterium]|nr:sigma-70 family RNA polymerase sigma factor [Sedimentisphaerales bacterium]
MKYKKDLLKLAAAVLNESSLAEDVVHDVFVRFAQSTDKLKLRGNLKSYLATCVVNRVRNIQKAMQLRESTSLSEAEMIVSKSERPEQWIIHSEQSNRLNNAMLKLPYKQREVIAMHYYGSMKFRAIAKSQDVSINTVLSRYRYGLDRLRLLLDSEVENEVG